MSLIKFRKTQYTATLSAAEVQAILAMLYTDKAALRFTSLPSKVATLERNSRMYHKNKFVKATFEVPLWETGELIPPFLVLPYH